MLLVLEGATQPQLAPKPKKSPRSPGFLVTLTRKAQDSFLPLGTRSKREGSIAHSIATPSLPPSQGQHRLAVYSLNTRVPSLFRSFAPTIARQPLSLSLSSSHDCSSTQKSASSRPDHDHGIGIQHLEWCWCGKWNWYSQCLQPTTCFLLERLAIHTH